MPRILVVDDEPDICQLIRRYAEHDGYETVGVTDGTEAVALCQKEVFDVIIMDVMMPDMDGYAACRKIRERKDIPVLMLSARGEEYDKLFGFEVGVDDYMTKPFSADELLWRVNALLRRANIALNKKIRVGSVMVDSQKYAVYNDSTYIEFPRKEFELLFKLLSYPDRIFSKNQLLDTVWGVNAESGEETVKTHISRIRARLRDIPEISIVTIKGLGYRADIKGEGEA